MFGNFFKPKWQHSNPKIRIKTIPDLTTQGKELIQIAQSDPHPEVRASAIQRLQHLPTLFILVKTKDNKTIIKLAQQRLVELSRTPAMDDKAIIMTFPFVEDEATLKHIAQNTTRSIKVRCSAINKLRQVENLVEIVTNDRSHKIQYHAAHLIGDWEQLQKIKKVAKKNKRIRQLLKERQRLEDEQQSLLDNLTTLCTEFLLLAETSGALDAVASIWAKNKTHALALQQRWKQLSQAEISAGFQPRYQQALDAFNIKLALYETQEQTRQPIRLLYQQILIELKQFIQQLQNTPENYTQIQIEEKTATLKQDWVNITADVLTEHEREDLQQQYQQLQQRLEKLYTSLLYDLQQLERLQHLHEKMVQLKKTAIDTRQYKQLQTQWKKIARPKSLQMMQVLQTKHINLSHSIEASIKKQQQQSKQNLSEIQKNLTLLEQYINAKKLNEAIQLFEKTRHLFRHGIPLPTKQAKQIEAKLHRLSPIIYEAKDWRHWGTDKAREQLIQDAQELAKNPNINPKIRLIKINELRTEWKKLSKLDPTRQQKLWQAFNQACGEAYQPSKQYFQQEAENRQINLQIRARICEELEKVAQQTDWDTVDWKKIAQVIKKLTQYWKKSGTVDRESWLIINARFNAAMDALEIYLSEERRINYQQRENLVIQARALNQITDMNEAIEEAKTLQQKWQPTIASHQNIEQKLWRNFKTAIDQVFAKQRNIRHANKEELLAQFKARQKICQKIEAITQLEGQDLLIQRTTVEVLKNNFNNLWPISKSHIKQIEKRWQYVYQNFTKKIQQQQWQLQRQQLQLLQQKAVICSTWEQQILSNIATTTLSERQQNWKKLAPLENNKLEQQLQIRYQRLNNSPIWHNKEQQHNLQTYLKNLLELEILLKLTTPKKYQQDRMKLQVSRLSEQMLSGQKISQMPKKDAIPHFHAVCQTGAIPHTTYEQIKTRFKQICKALDIL